MDAVKYIKEKVRMCEKYSYCGDCPLREINKEGTSCEDAIQKHTEEAVAIVEKWSKEHSLMTNGEKAIELLKETGLWGHISCIDGGNFIHIRTDRDWWNAPWKEKVDDGEQERFI